MEGRGTRTPVAWVYSEGEIRTSAEQRLKDYVTQTGIQRITKGCMYLRKKKPNVKGKMGVEGKKGRA